MEPGYYDQPTVAQEFAEALLKAHGNKLQNIPLRIPDQHIAGFARKPDSTLYDLLQFALVDEETATDAVHLFRRELNLVTE